MINGAEEVKNVPQETLFAYEGEDVYLDFLISLKKNDPDAFKYLMEGGDPYQNIRNGFDRKFDKWSQQRNSRSGIQHLKNNLKSCR